MNATVAAVVLRPPVVRPGSAIELYARRSDAYEARVAASLALLRQAATEHAGQVVFASSLGAEDQVVTDLIASHALPIAVGTLVTGRLHDETVALIDRTEAHFAATGLHIERHAPDAQAVARFIAAEGEDPMYRSLALRKACCAVRKLEPLARLLEGRSAWITGLRREQSDARGGVSPRETGADGRVKFAPLADWTWADVWWHIASRGLPYNPLHDAFMPSIGCAPCTRAIAVGEPFRAGRWWWEDEAAKECGLHVKSPAVLPLPAR
jgi:phosphoadenosine phosphosulfate reductase